MENREQQLKEAMDIASKKAVERLKEVFSENVTPSSVEQTEENIIDSNRDEWTWYMQGYKDSFEYHSLPTKSVDELREKINSLRSILNESCDLSRLSVREHVLCKGLLTDIEHLQPIQEQKESDAVQFAEWCQVNGWHYHSIHKDWYNDTMQPFKTTYQLYTQFINQQNK